MYDNIPKLEEFIKAAEAKRVSMSEHDDYLLFKYKTETQQARDWDEVTLLSRGIVFDKLTGECVAYPFKKFFNLNETGCELSAMQEGEYEILEKLDGSMGCIFLDRHDELQVFTPGSFVSEQAIWATKWLRNHKRYNKIKSLFQDFEVNALVVEIICPLSKVVVLYKDQGLTLTAGQQLCSIAAGVRYSTHEELECLGEVCGLLVCDKPVFTSVDDIKKYLTTVSNFEGFVLHWPATGFRIKMKAAEYIINHRILSSIHPNRIDEAIRNCEGYKLTDYLHDIFAVIEKFPEEHIDPYTEGFNDLTNMVYCNGMKIQDIAWKYRDNTAKELALSLRDGVVGEFGKENFGFIMSEYNGKYYLKKLFEKEWGIIRERIFGDNDDE